MAIGRITARSRGLVGLMTLALVGALLVPLAVVSTASADVTQGCPGVAQGCNDQVECPNGNFNGITQGDVEVCCSTELMPDRGLAQGGSDVGVACCPDGTFGHWQWGGYSGQNLYYCDAPPNEPPATAAPATDPSAVSPATAAPKKAAAAAKPTFTG